MENSRVFMELFELLSEPAHEGENEDIEYYKNKVYTALDIIAEKI